MSPPSDQVSNGVSVGAPKVFDNRTLTIMLESLSATLQSMQSQQFVDQKTLSAALTAIQGSRSTETNSAVTVLGSPVPSVTQTVPTGGTTLTPSTVTTPAVTPTPPTLTDIPAFSGFTPSFGASAGDLLNDSINLNYQIFNLRMILERALSDRLSGDRERLQTVLGFNISIDPPRTAADSVAVVEITLRVDSADETTAGPGARDLSLVALMPQEKTYNAAALSSKSNAFGGSAVVSAFQVGVSTRRREQTFYLYRDSDTIAYERMTGKPGELVFGWMFRPVLGRRSVSPGLRQLFAVAALPGADCEKCAPRKLKATASTFWKKYDGGTLTSFEDCDANRGTRFRYAATFGLSRPEIFEPRYTNSREYPPVTVKSTYEYEHGLHPRVHDVRWTPVGAANALITVQGGNFFTGTQVILGDKTYGPAEGLVLKSNDTFQLMTTQDSLASGTAMVSGRYASPEPLEATLDSIKSLPLLELRDPVELDPAIGGKRKVKLTIVGRDSDGSAIPITVGDLPDEQHPPLITINGHSAQQPYQRSHDRTSVSYETSFDDDFLEKGFAVVRITWPMLPKRFSLTRRTSDPKLAYQIVRVGDKTILLQTTILAGFLNEIDNPKVPLDSKHCWQLFAGDTPITLTTENCMGTRSVLSKSAGKKSTGHKSPASKSGATEPVVKDAGPNAISVTMDTVPDKVVLLEPKFQTAFILDVPKVNGPPKSDGAAAVTVNQFDSVIVPLTVAKANNVASVTADLKPVVFVPKSDKPEETTINVQVTRDLSSKPGAVDLTILDKQGKPTTARLFINAVIIRKNEAK